MQSQQWTSITPIILIQCRSLPHLEPFILENKVMLTRQHKRYRYRSSLWKIRVQILKDVPIHQHSIWMETIQEFACHYHLCIIPATKQKIVQPVRVTKCRVGKRRQSQIFHVRYILERLGVQSILVKRTTGCGIVQDREVTAKITQHPWGNKYSTK